jgi:hypothetical protein
MKKGPDESETRRPGRRKVEGRKRNSGGESGADTWVAGSGGRERSDGDE